MSSGIYEVTPILAKWTDETEPGLLGFVADGHFPKDVPKLVKFPVSERPLLVWLARGGTCRFGVTEPWVAGPGWMEVRECVALELEFASLGESLTAWWGAVVADSKHVIGGSVTVPRVDGKYSNVVWHADLVRDLLPDGLHFTVTSAVVGKEERQNMLRRFVMPKHIKYQTVSRGGIMSVPFDQAMEYALGWESNEGFSIPLDFLVEGGRVIFASIGDFRR